MNDADKMDELRRVVARILGEDPDTWPDHGNTPLAIASIVALLVQAQGKPTGWLRAIDEALVTTHLGIASESDNYYIAKRKLDALIDWHIAVATDPAVNGGWKLVPVEPTEEWVNNLMESGGMRVGSLRSAISDVLAAAPTPPVTAENTSQERVRSEAEIEHEPARWGWRYPSGKIDFLTHASRSECVQSMGRYRGEAVPLYLHQPTLRSRNTTPGKGN